MIENHDRSGYIGASDVGYVTGNWRTRTWQKWWLQKLGVNQEHWDNRYTIAGTNWEHKVLDSLGIVGLQKDRQIILEDLRLRVNLDGNTAERIKEVKTYRWDKGFRMPKKYIYQVQVQMFASHIYGADIVAYGLEEADYDNFFREVDPRRRREYPVDYDPRWIETVYLPKHMILCQCLKQGVMPSEAII